MRALIILILASLSLASPSKLLLQLEKNDEAWVTMEAESESVGTFVAQKNGLVTIPRPAYTGVFEIYVSSQHWVYPRVQLITSSSKLSARETLLVNDTEISARNGIYSVAHVRTIEFYDVVVPFSLWNLLGSPMMLMGLVTMGMMGVMQVLIASLGDIDEVRKELRGETNDEKTDEMKLKNE